MVKQKRSFLKFSWIYLKGKYQAYGKCRSFMLRCARQGMKISWASEITMSMENKTEQQIPEDLLDSVGENLPTFEEIERFAKDGTPPKSCIGARGDGAERILLA
jgi:hypothetical protein